MDVQHGIESQNRRVAVLKRWLAKPPARTHALRLVAVGDPPHTLLEWPREAVVPMLAHEIDAATAEHAEEMGLAEARFLLAFVGEAGESLVTKPLSVRPPVDGQTPLDVAAQLDGSERAFNVNLARYHEAHVRMYLTGHQALLQGHQAQNQMLLTICDKFATRIVESEERADAAREALHALREAMQEFREATIEDEAPAMSEAQKKFLDLAEKLAPVLLAKLGSSGGG